MKLPDYCIMQISKIRQICFHFLDARLDRFKAINIVSSKNGQVLHFFCVWRIKLCIFEHKKTLKIIDLQPLRISALELGPN